MNIEPMPAETVRAAEKCCKGADGKALCDAANSLLQCKDTPVQAGVETVNGAPVLNRILKKLQEDPYRCLGVAKTCDSSEVKKLIGSSPCSTIPIKMRIGRPPCLRRSSGPILC